MPLSGPGQPWFLLTDASLAVSNCHTQAPAPRTSMQRPRSAGGFALFCLIWSEYLVTFGNFLTNFIHSKDRSSLQLPIRVPQQLVERDRFLQIHVQYILNYGWMVGLDIPAADLSLPSVYGCRQDINSFFLFLGLFWVSTLKQHVPLPFTVQTAWQSDFSTLWIKQLLEFHYSVGLASCYGDITAQYQFRVSWSFVQVLESWVCACIYECACMHT